MQKGVPFDKITNLPQTAYRCRRLDRPSDTDIFLHPFEECLKDKTRQAENFRIIEEESNKIAASRIIQQTGDYYIAVNPPYPPVSTEELDAWYDLPYTRLPHPRYKNRTVPAYEMIRHSVTLHRGCFGGCAFCTISAHQGKHVVSRSEASVLGEIKKVTEMPDFKGYISDLGGPSANMYRMNGKDITLCRKCGKPSCIFPKVCANLLADPRPLQALYDKAGKIPGIKKIFISSGIRYDLLLHRSDDEAVNSANRHYVETLIRNHVSGRLKVAPEHTEQHVLRLMRKPPFAVFERFKDIFDRINAEYGLRQQIVPYFISSHPASTEPDMVELAVKTKKMNFRLEQVQDFTPTPMTLATEIFYTSVNPYNTSEKIYSAVTAAEKRSQRQFFFWYLDENRREITRFLQKLNRQDLIRKLWGQAVPGDR
jgi:uncharacterized radical SAM protein YgiQ